MKLMSRLRSPSGSCACPTFRICGAVPEPRSVFRPWWHPSQHLVRIFTSDDDEMIILLLLFLLLLLLLLLLSSILSVCTPTAHDLSLRWTVPITRRHQHSTF